MVAEIAALVIFVIMFLLIVLDRIPRQWVTLGCGALMLVLVFGICMHDGGAIWDTLNLSAFGQSTFWYGASESSGGINWSTIFFIAGMMIMVEGLGKAGFFRWLCLTIAKAVHYKTIPIFISFMLMSAFLAMFIDSITVILFLAAVTVELAHLLHFDPIPMIISEIFCSNLGGSATMCGDPPNIIIGTSLGYSFKDFILNTGMMAGVSLIFVVLFFYFSFRKELKASEKHDEAVTYPSPQEAIADQKRFVVSVVIFAAAIVMLVTAFVVFIERGQRRITVNYAKRQVGNRIYGGQSSYLPLKINMANVIPPIFASSLILFPATLASWFTSGDSTRWIRDLAASLSPGQPLYTLLYAALIVFFAYFYTALVFNPKETAENLKKSGAFVPGIRPGEQTSRYIDKVLLRLTLAGSIYLVFVCLVPEFLNLRFNVPFYFGGTSLLIVVVVTMDFMSQVQAYLMSHQYESLLKKTNFRGFGPGSLPR